MNIATSVAWPANRRRMALTVADLLIWGFAYAGSALASFVPVAGDLKIFVIVLLVTLSTQLVIGIVTGLYRGRTALGSVEQAVLTSAVVGAATAGGLAAEITLDMRAFEFQGHVLAGLLALTGMGALRVFLRRAVERLRRPDRSVGERVLIFGAGIGGQQLLRSMLTSSHGNLVPVGFLDDDPSRRHLRVLGMPVLGGRGAIAAAADQTAAQTLVIAIPSADAALVRRLAALASPVGLTVKTLPTVSELPSANVAISDVRDLDLADLLGRRQVDTDLASIAHCVTGKRVLVTGAGGSIGSELCRQLHNLAPAELIMLDRDESALHAVELSIFGHGLLDSPDLVLCDLRDADSMRQVFRARAPEVVFHAAALKHLPMLERYPSEAVRTNVWGTLTTLEAAEEVGVGTFVNISTDKAADPTSVLGFSKRIGERLTADAAERSGRRYLSVRFGNVLGSRGSVLTAFVTQLCEHRPLTITHPDVTRYFMTVEEAVQLVIQAAAIGSGGEVLVLDMGEPVRIDDVARRLVEQSPQQVDVVYTGLRPGEKLHEDLFGPDERDVRPMHPLISHVYASPVHPGDVRNLDPRLERSQVTEALRVLCTSTSLTAVGSRTATAV